MFGKMMVGAVLPTPAHLATELEVQMHPQSTFAPPPASKFLIYALVDPETGEPRYVGRSSSGMKRPGQHALRATREKTYKARWVAGLLARGLTPRIDVLECCPNADALNEAECRWISVLRSQGCRLTNLTDGGAGVSGFKRGAPSEETRQRIREALIGKTASQEARAKISAAHKGRVMSAEHAARLADANRRRALALSLEERARIGETFGALNRGRKPTPETLAKLSAALKGHPVSDETREKIRAANIGRVMSREAIEKAASARRGRPVSEEARQKLSAALRGRKMPRAAVEKSANTRRGRKASPEDVEKNRLAHLGQVITPEHRAKLSAATKGRPKSEEWKAKARAARLALPADVRCRKHTDEERAKMSAAQLRRKSA